MRGQHVNAARPRPLSSISCALHQIRGAILRRPQGLADRRSMSPGPTLRGPPVNHTPIRGKSLDNQDGRATLAPRFGATGLSGRCFTKRMTEEVRNAVILQ